MSRHLTEVGTELLNATLKLQTEPLRRVAEDTGIRATAMEVKLVLGSMSSRTATGLDVIPASVLKQLGDLGNEYTAKLFNEVLAGEKEIPTDWGMGRVTLLEKANSVRDDLTTYRPITISTVLYRLIAKIICNRITVWMEENEISGRCR